jgi:hypothetical protein
MQAIPIALMAAGSIIKGVGGYQSAKYNQKVDKVNAVNAEREGTAQEARIRDAARIAEGRQIGAQAESGFEVGTGTALDSLMESQINAELDAMDARRQARSRYDAYRSQAHLAKMEGTNALIGGFVGAASSVASGIQDYATAKGGG